MFVLAGTGPVTDPGACPGQSAPVGVAITSTGGTLSPNRAVLLNGPFAKVLAVQDKRAGFTITPNLLADYGLATAVHESHDEGMEPGSRMTVVESRAGRFAIYVCEDLGREIDLAPQLVELGITHLIVPILATPMEEYRWQQMASSHIAQRAGTTTIVINSATLGRFLGSDPARTLLVVEPAAGGSPCCRQLAAQRSCGIHDPRTGRGHRPPVHRQVTVTGTRVARPQRHRSR